MVISAFDRIENIVGKIVATSIYSISPQCFQNISFVERLSLDCVVKSYKKKTTHQNSDFVNFCK